MNGDLLSDILNTMVLDLDSANKFLIIKVSL